MWGALSILVPLRPNAATTLGTYATASGRSSSEAGIGRRCCHGRRASVPASRPRQEQSQSTISGLRVAHRSLPAPLLRRMEERQRRCSLYAAPFGVKSHAAATAARLSRMARRPRRLVAGAPGRVHRRNARSGRALPGLRAARTSLAGAAYANPRVAEASSDARLHGFVVGGYTRGGDAEPGSRCKSDTVLATVTRELNPTSPLGNRPGKARVRALDLGVRRLPASSCSADPRAMEGLCRPIMPAVIARGAPTTRGRGCRRVLLSTSDCLLRLSRPSWNFVTAVPG
jgi:hypothetical protein